MQPGDPPWELGVVQTPSGESTQGPGEKDEGKRIMERDPELNQESTRNTEPVLEASTGQFRQTLKCNKETQWRPQPTQRPNCSEKGQNYTGILVLTLSNLKVLEQALNVFKPQVSHL